MVYSLIGFINLSKGVKNFEITVLTEDVARVHQIKDTLELCNENIPIGLKIIYLETSVESLINVRKASLSNTIQYDYIEYNCGISKSSNPLDQLQGITSYLLSDAGSIGISYFTKNVHYSNIQKYISNRNATAHIPFSLQAHRFIKNYFNLHGLTVLENDQDLVTFLGGNTEASFPPRRLSEVEPRLDWKAYSKEEALNLIHSSGLQTQSWMPTAYAYPYGKFK